MIKDRDLERLDVISVVTNWEGRGFTSFPNLFPNPFLPSQGKDGKPLNPLMIMRH
jgi:hypothetical protein